MSSFYGNLESDYDREYSDSELLRRYGKYVLNHKRYLYRTIIAIIISTIFTLILPFPLQIAVDGIIDNEDTLVIQMAIIFMIVYIIVWVADYFRAFENTRFTAKSTNDIRRDLFVKLQKHDLSFYDKQNTGLLQSRIMDDTQVLAFFFE